MKRTIFPLKHSGIILGLLIVTGRHCWPEQGLVGRQMVTLEGTAAVLQADVAGGAINVSDEITNVNKLGRLYNIVQHPSIAPPFLDESVIVDCNALKGYMQESPMPTPEEPTLYWPKNFYHGNVVDFRYLTDNPNPAVRTAAGTSEIVL